MPGTGPPPRNGTTWRHALVGGLASLPFTTLSYWQTGSELSLGPVLFGGVLAGYLAKRAGSGCTGVGTRAGIVGGLPVLWVLFDVLAATSGLAGPTWFVTGATLLTIGFTIVVGVLGFGIAALVGEVGARIGGWLAGKRPDGSTPVANG